jgi:hypothetical protein
MPPEPLWIADMGIIGNARIIQVRDLNHRVNDPGFMDSRIRDSGSVISDD